MRVVSGSARGKKLLAVPGQGTRPILDRVKTALFDILRPRVPGAVVLDLFAGSGGIGIQALSQGAEHCTFLDIGHRAVATIKKNLEITGLADRAEVRKVDAFAYLKTADKTFDLIFVAPPQYKGLWLRAMNQIAERPALLRTPAGLIVVQIDPREYTPLTLEAIQETRQKQYGNTLLVFFEWAGGEP